MDKNNNINFIELKNEKIIQALIYIKFLVKEINLSKQNNKSEIKNNKNQSIIFCSFISDTNKNIIVIKKE